MSARTAMMRTPGTRSAPVATLQKAQTLARVSAGQEPVTVHVADGVYYLPETLVFTAADSGTADAPITYQAENEGGAVLSGGTRLDLTWQPYRDRHLHGEDRARVGHRSTVCRRTQSTNGSLSQFRRTQENRSLPRVSPPMRFLRNGQRVGPIQPEGTSTRCIGRVGVATTTGSRERMQTAT